MLYLYRCIRDIKTRNEQSKQHYWFKGVFSEANKNVDDEEDKNDDADEDEGDRFFEF